MRYIFDFLKVLYGIFNLIFCFPFAVAVSGLNFARSAALANTLVDASEARHRAVKLGWTGEDVRLVVVPVAAAAAFCCRFLFFSFAFIFLLKIRSLIAFAFDED